MILPFPPRQRRQANAEIVRNLFDRLSARLRQTNSFLFEIFRE